MNRDDIIRMAREAGMFVHKEVQPELERFAALVAAAELRRLHAEIEHKESLLRQQQALTREEIIRMAQQSGRERRNNQDDMGTLLRQALEALEDSHQNINPERGFADELEKQIEAAITAIRQHLEGSHD